MMYGYRGYGFPFMGFAMFIGMLFCFLFIAVVIYIIYRITRGNSGRNIERNIESTRALNILDEKFAAGEINEEEYLKRKTMLKQR